MSNDLFQSDTLVCDVLTDHPKAFQVFETYGMCGSCKDAPPPFPLHYFADQHGVDVHQLIGELTECVSGNGDSVD